MRRGDIATLGRLMNESHVSLRDNYEFQRRIEQGSLRVCIQKVKEVNFEIMVYHI